VLEEVGEPAGDGEIAEVVVAHGGGGIDPCLAQLRTRPIVADLIAANACRSALVPSASSGL
jgi:hypothetical protein